MSLGRQAATGAVWNYAAFLVSKGLLFVATLVLARILSPAEFGLVGMALLVITLLDILRDHPASAGELAEALPIARPGVSRHLRVMREAGLVEVRTDAQRRIYRLRTEPLREIDEWLAPYRAAWAGRLDVLEAHLDDMED